MWLDCFKKPQRGEGKKEQVGLEVKQSGHEPQELKWVRVELGQQVWGEPQDHCSSLRTLSWSLVMNSAPHTTESANVKK